MYAVEGLRPATEYVFRFQAVNEAGWGDMMEITAETQAVNPPEVESHGTVAVCSPAAFAGVLFSFLLAITFDRRPRL